MAAARDNQTSTSSTLRQRRLKQDEEEEWGNGTIASAIAQATVPQWVSLTLMLSLIFGGCCANVLALEALIKDAPGSGTLITFAQFFLTALFSAPRYISLNRGIKHLYLKERAIPLHKWIIYTGFFLAVNLLNNKAFHYKISLPLHIILRSAGPVSSMFVGYIFGRRYTKRQIFAVFLLFIGVVVAALADARAKGSKIVLFDKTSEPAAVDQSSSNNSTIGFVLLFLALMLSAFMGVYTDRTYARYGRNHWGENLFYSHALSLPIMLYNYPTMRQDFGNMLASEPISSVYTASTNSSSSTYPSWSASTFSALQFTLPKQLLNLPSQPFYLLLNALTQYLCIRGVNLLSAKSSSLTVVIVLNVRKLVSLVLSIWLFGNQLPVGVTLGAVVVFAGAGMYALPSSRGRSTATQKSETKVLGGQEQKGGRGNHEIGTKGDDRSISTNGQASSESIRKRK